MKAGSDGNVCCYSYRDPNLPGTRAAFAAMADFLEDWLKQGEDLESTVIGTVNTTDPLVGPSTALSLECSRYLRGVSHASFYKREISSLNTMEDIYRVAGEVVRDLR